MITQTSFPVFESGQVLTSAHLNELTDYLEQQDRLTRQRLLGIGIVCGLQPAYVDAAGELRITRGCAVTSEGYLVTLDDCVLTRYARFTPPVPSAEEVENGSEPEPPYEPFLKDGEPIELWELLAEGEQPTGEEVVLDLGPGSLNQRVVLLYLERRRESLKSCNINDCSDKGAEMRFTVRKLLVSRADADAILAREAKLAGRVTDAARHPRYDLNEALIEDVIPASHGIRTFAALAQRMSAIVSVAKADLERALGASSKAFAYLLRDLYPAASFPNGPFPAGCLDRVRVSGSDIILAQYVYDAFHDVVRSYNEFLDAALRLDAECCPASDRFPRHVLLGFARAPRSAFVPDATVAPIHADSGWGPRERPLPYRHHFIPSPILDRGDERYREVRSLHYRTFLLALRFSLAGRDGAAVRITPSRDGGAPLSARAIPFHYDFRRGDDLHRNWSFQDTVTAELGRVQGYALIGDPHPLTRRLDGHDFLRVEGIVGQPLSVALDQILRQKLALGLPFAVEPVYLGAGAFSPAIGNTIDDAELELAEAAIGPLAACRLADLEPLFFTMSLLVFTEVVQILAGVSKMSTKSLAGAGRAAGGAGEQAGAASRRDAAPARGGEPTLAELRRKPYAKGLMTANLAGAGDPAESVGAFAKAVRESVAGGELFDRVRRQARALGLADGPREAAALHAAVSLADKAEDLIELVSRPSLAGFDFADFERRRASFNFAYAEYVTHVPASELPVYVNLGAMHAGAMTDKPTGTSASAGSMTSSIADELKQRLRKIRDEFVFRDYSVRHPGLVHMAGVPRGGTLVLCYVHRETFMKRLAGAGVAASAETGFLALATRRRATRASTSGLAHSAGNEALAHAVATEVGIQPSRKRDAPLDDFVVVADFCLPYMCCDALCLDALGAKLVGLGSLAGFVPSGGGTSGTHEDAGTTPGGGDTPIVVDTGPVNVPIHEELPDFVEHPILPDPGDPVPFHGDDVVVVGPDPGVTDPTDLHDTTNPAPGPGPIHVNPIGGVTAPPVNPATGGVTAVPPVAVPGITLGPTPAVTTPAPIALPETPVVAPEGGTAGPVRPGATTDRPAAAIGGATGTAVGRILGSPGGTAAAPALLTGALVNAVKAGDRRPVPVKVDRGTYTLTAAPGEYRITATCAGHADVTLVVELREGQRTTRDITLTKTARR